MRVARAVPPTNVLTAAMLVFVGALSWASASATAEGPALPPAPYKPLPVGTKITYDNAAYVVTRTEGYVTVFQKLRGTRPGWITTHALLGEYGTDVYATCSGWRVSTNEFNFRSEGMKKLEALWPLAVGKGATYQLDENSGCFLNTWTIMLRVTGTETIEAAGRKVSTYVIEERIESDQGMSLEGRKWYHPESGLIVRSTRTGIGNEIVTLTYGRILAANLKNGEEDSLSLRQVEFPPGTTANVPMAAWAPAGAGLVATADSNPPAELTRSAGPAARQSSDAELARLRREAERAKQEAELERLKRDAELARLQLETERAKQEAEIARLKLEAERARKEGEATRRSLAGRDRNDSDERTWASIKSSRTMASFEDYLARYPAGRYRVEAQARLGALEKLAAVAGVEFGNYHALIIGIDAYKNLPKLKTAANDAKTVARVLEKNYGFKVTLLLNPDRAQIIEALDTLRETLGRKDNLLVYYAGHGFLDKEADRGYWLAVDAQPNRRTNWISNATVTDTLRTLQAKHVMVVADSCYSGTLTRDANVALRSGDYWKRMAEKWARVAMVSGGLEPVADSGGGGHSPFAKAFTDALRGNDAIVDGTQLFNEIRRPVMTAARQTPQYSDVRDAGHDGGDFLFVRKK